MLHSLTYLESRKTLGDSGTLTVDINVRDPITALWVEVRATNGSSGNRSNLVADCITKIEVIDGGKTLISLTGHQAYALAAHLLNNLPEQLISEVPGLIQNYSVPLMFGRWIGDPVYAFDPSKYVMPQVRIQWNLAAITAVGVTGFTTATGTLTVVADILEGGPVPVGLLTSKEAYQFTTAASGIEYIDLPRDFPLCGVLARVAEDTVSFDSNVSNIKLNADQGKYVPFDFRSTDLIHYLQLGRVPFNYNHIFHAYDGLTIKWILKYLEGATFYGENADHVIGEVYGGYGDAVLRSYLAGLVTTVAHNIYATCRGWLPFDALYIPFGEPTDPEDWFPAASLKALRLELTQANAGAAASLVTRQAEPYL
jgi:hypothetical protein